MSFAVGETVWLKDTGVKGLITAENGHACKLLGHWFHADDIERAYHEQSIAITVHSLVGEVLMTLSLPVTTTGTQLLSLVRKKSGTHVTDLVFHDGLRAGDQCLTVSDTAVSAIIGTSKFKMRWRRGWVDDGKDDVCVQVVPQSLAKFFSQHAEPMRNDPFHNIPGGKYQPRVREIEEKHDATLVLSKLDAVTTDVSLDLTVRRNIDIARSLLSDAGSCLYYQWSGFNEEGALVHLPDSKHRGVVAFVMGHVVDISHRSSQ